MESTMENFLIDLEAEHLSLIDKTTVLENEIVRLTHQNEELQKTLDKQKVFHRNYADEVAAMEKVLIRDFKDERLSLNEQNRNLAKINRQLNIDVSFYKQAYEELSAESDRVCNSQTNRAPGSSSNLLVSPPHHVTTKNATRRAITTATTATVTCEPESISRLPMDCKCKHTSSRVLTKVNEKMFEENKKLKSKISSLSATVTILTRKNKQLENFRKKIDNKKLKFQEDSEELDLLIESTKKKNKHTFNAEALKMLRETILN